MEFNFLYYLQTLHGPLLDKLMTAVSGLGDAGFLWILLGTVLICFAKTRKMGVAVLLSLLAGFLIGNLALKNLVARPRPCWIDGSVPLIVASPADFSFPSGHTLAAFEAAVSIFLLNKKWGCAALVMASAIAFSRLYLFVHFPTDVVGGMVLGAAIAFAVHHLLGRIWETRFQTPPGGGSE